MQNAASLQFYADFFLQVYRKDLGHRDLRCRLATYIYDFKELYMQIQYGPVDIISFLCIAAVFSCARHRASCSLDCGEMAFCLDRALLTRKVLMEISAKFVRWTREPVKSAVICMCID